MDQQNDGLWWAVTVVDGAVGSGMFVYGIRQKKGLPLAMGLALNIIPMVAANGTLGLAFTVLAGVAYFALAKTVR